MLQSKGRFSELSWGLILLTQTVFIALPWLKIDGHPSVLFDLNERRFILFNLVIYPDDFGILLQLSFIGLLVLLLSTALFGRVWCGFLCPQTLYSRIYKWIEIKTESIAHKSFKYSAWFLISASFGFVTMSYFTPVEDLIDAVLALQLNAWTLFWWIFYSAAAFVNAGVLREKVCTNMCPYARLQKLLTDRQTVFVMYDKSRGEPRGISKTDACTNCQRCVQVCPTQIDVRDGIQFQCIGCGACIDECDQEMEKMRFRKGLIHFTSVHALENSQPQRSVFRAFVSPQRLILKSLLVLFILHLSMTLMTRPTFQMHVGSFNGLDSRVAENATLENIYKLQVMNNSLSDEDYQITVNGIDGIKLMSAPKIHISAAHSESFPLKIQIPFSEKYQSKHSFELTIHSLGSNESQMQKIKFNIQKQILDLRSG